MGFPASGRHEKTISIVTAAHESSAPFFAETALSVTSQEVPTGWKVEWLVQEDGEAPSLSRIVDSLPNVRYEANGTQLGIPATRNAALSRATGGLIQVLDHDDVLLPDALAALVRHFDDVNIHWAVAQADDLLPDGTRRRFASVLNAGSIAAGSVNDWAIEHGGRWPIHCAGLMMRTQTLRAVGGWAGTATDDDISAFAAISELFDGYNEPSTTWLYRHHDRQTHRSNAWRERSANGRWAALQRVHALRTLRTSNEVRA